MNQKTTKTTAKTATAQAQAQAQAQKEEATHTSEGHVSVPSSSAKDEAAKRREKRVRKQAKRALRKIKLRYIRQTLLAEDEIGLGQLAENLGLTLNMILQPPGERKQHNLRLLATVCVAQQALDRGHSVLADLPALAAVLYPSQREAFLAGRQFVDCLLPQLSRKHWERFFRRVCKAVRRFDWEASVTYEA